MRDSHQYSHHENITDAGVKRHITDAGVKRQVGCSGLGFKGASCAGGRFLQVSENWNHCIWSWPVPSYSLMSPFFQLVIVFIGQGDLRFEKIQLV